MGKTKQKIINKSLELFNIHGISNVSIRQIAQEISISHSNLIYHYPGKEEIILSLHDSLLKRAYEINKGIDPEQFSLIKFFDITKTGFTVVYEYRFLFNDLKHICSSYPRIKTMLIDVEKLRSDMYLGIIELMIEKNLMRKSEFKIEYIQLVDLIKIYSDHWLVSSSIYDDLTESKRIEKYAFLLLSYFYPYLTAAGKSEFREIQMAIFGSD